MTVLPHRISKKLIGKRMGRLVDPARELDFTFDGKKMTGYAGDTLASALMANGVRVVGRSFKYHRPRGVMGIGTNEPNALFAVGDHDRMEPNLQGTMVELYNGLKATSQNRWPSLDFDVGELNNRLSRFFPAGFYYKTFMYPQAFWKHVYEPMIRNIAGLGPAPSAPDPDRYEHVHVHCDVLVVGGGVAGLAAALSAADAGARVILCDENNRLGGQADITSEKIDDAPSLNWAKAAAEELAGNENVQILTRTTATGHYDHNFVLMCERINDHQPEMLYAGAPRHRLWKVRAKEVILATGALERPLTFADNDRPGVILAGSARAHVRRYGVTPGSTAVIFTNNDDAYETQQVLHEAGVAVTRIVDTRVNPDGVLIDQAKALGVNMSVGSAITSVKTESGGQTIKGVTVSPLDNPGGPARVIEEECDFICVSGGYNPVVHLYSHGSGTLTFDDDLQAFRPASTKERIRCVGSANGKMDTADVIEEGFIAGTEAAKAVGKTGGTARSVHCEKRQTSKLEPHWFLPADGPKAKGNKHFVDFQNDVSAADLRLAVREGYRSVEHVKRYTTLGMATDQGKTSNISGLGVISDAVGAAIPEVGTTKFRPPYTPFSFGAFVGSHRGKLFQPVRHTPIQKWHEDNNAVFEPIGQWRRPYAFLKGHEKRNDAVKREVMTVRQKVGLLDASTLGKIEVTGPDAGAFLDLMYSNMMSTLKLGKCRYGLMLNDAGFLFDDGVTVRLGDEKFLVHTTSGNSDHIVSWLERWHQTEWPHLKVFITPVTEQWAQFAIAGPSARKVLEKLESSISFTNDAFPFLTFQEGTIDDIPVRVFRISFSGELSFEIAAPAGLGFVLWKKIMEAGAEFEIEPYGTEALHIMRAEKGFIAIGDETDGTVTPLDLGLDWAVSKKKADFVGKRALQLSDLARADRKHFVGLLTDDPERVLPDGAQAIEGQTVRAPFKPVGYVSSTYYSPTLERSIAFGLIENGRQRMGETINLTLGNTVIPAQITSPIFYDEKGDRQNV